MPKVKYEVQHAVIDVTEAEYSLVHSLYALPEPQKVIAIKFIRAAYNLELRHAKSICDAIGFGPAPHQLDGE